MLLSSAQRRKVLSEESDADMFDELRCLWRDYYDGKGWLLFTAVLSDYDKYKYLLADNVDDIKKVLSESVQFVNFVDGILKYDMHGKSIPKWDIIGKATIKNNRIKIIGKVVFDITEEGKDA